MISADEARSKLAERLDFDKLFDSYAENQITEAIEKKETRCHVDIPRAKFLKLSNDKIKAMIIKWANSWGYDVAINRMDTLGTQYAFVGFFLSWEVKAT